MTNLFCIMAGLNLMHPMDKLPPPNTTQIPILQTMNSVRKGLPEESSTGFGDKLVNNLPAMFAGVKLIQGIAQLRQAKRQKERARKARV